MQTTHLVDNIIGGTKMEMVGVAEQDLAVDALQIFGRQGPLDGSLCADIHKNRCLDLTVRCRIYTAAGSAFGR